MELPYEAFEIVYNHLKVGDVLTCNSDEYRMLTIRLRLGFAITTSSSILVL